jgi:hypothetical protein
VLGTLPFRSWHGAVGTGREVAAIKKYLGLPVEGWTVIGVIATIVGVVVAIIQFQGPGRSAAGTQPTAGTQQSTPASSPTAPPTSPSQGGWSHRQWGPGSLLLTALKNVDMDSVPPNVNDPSGLSTDVSLYDNQLQAGGQIAPWTGTGAPTAAGCAEMISTHGVEGVKPEQGHVICLKTGEGNIAILTVQQVETDDSDSMTAVTIRATVWSSG